MYFNNVENNIIPGYYTISKYLINPIRETLTIYCDNNLLFTYINRYTLLKCLSRAMRLNNTKMFYQIQKKNSNRFFIR